ncbi:hypothetical protein MP228_003962 [Amoeboaphelidium protococcarum]|nr:hypothetical protein MP228_003962 [Amoeboaphelidium protococcarum]
MTSLAELLLYRAPAAQICDRNKGRSSTRLTVAANPRDLEECSILQWEGFDIEVVRHFEQFKASLSDKLIKVFPEVSPPYVSSENDVQNAIHNYICILVRKIFEHYGERIVINPGAGRFCGNPDISVQQIVDGRLKDIIPVEVKSMWAFDVGDELSDVLNDGANDDYQKVKKVVSQVYGYMSISHCKYGILCTYDKFYFLKRDGQQQGSTLLISKMVHRDQSSPYTVVKALSALILAACEDHFYSSPYSTPPFSRRQILKDAEHSLGYQKFFVTLQQLYIDQMASRNYQSSIMRGGFAKEARYQRVIKLVDVAKCPDAAADLAREVRAYQLLELLQGTVIPKFYGYIDLAGSFDCLMIEDLDTGLEDDQCKDIEIQIIDKVKLQLAQMHLLGVAHGDIALRNIIIHRDSLESNRDDAVRILDFGQCSFQGDSDVDFDAASLKDLQNADQLFQNQ